MKKSITIIAILAMVSWGANGQTVIFNLLQAPCNYDGILVIQTTGIATPYRISIQGDFYYPGNIISNTVNDTLFNYNGDSIQVGINDYLSNAFIISATYGGNPPFDDSVHTTSAVCPASGQTTAYVFNGGVPPYTVEWYLQGAIVNLSIPSATGNPVTIPNGGYIVRITDSNGCMDLTYASVISYVPTFNYTVSSTDANCTNGTATANIPIGGVPPFTYLWANGSTSPSINNLMMGNYQVTLTDATGCYDSHFAYVQQLTTINDTTLVTPATCLNNDGSLITFGSGGVSPYSYLWTNGQTTQTISGLLGNTYHQVTVTDANGCIGYGGGMVTSATPITVTDSISSSLCTSPTGTSTLTIAGGTLPYTIVWNTFPVQTGATATGLSSGQYYFTITDSVGCVRTGNVYIPPVSQITGVINGNSPMCTSPNGSAVMTIYTGTPPYSYVWNTGATTPSISGLVQGVYSCTAIDSMGCQITKHINLYQSSPLALYFSSTPASCIFISDGTATVNVIGGTPPYTYNWSSGSTSATATGLATGWYWLTVHDAAGCVTNQNCFVNYNSANNTCYCTISGTVYDDANTNCVLDMGEQGIEHIMIDLTGRGYTFTDANGNYSFIAPTGNYTLSESVGNYYPLGGCQNNLIPITAVASSGCVITNNVANVINPLHDISIYTSYFQTPPIPGNLYQQNVLVINQGTIAEPAIQLGYKNDGQLGAATVSPNLFAQLNSGMDPDWYSVVNGFPSLAPGTNQFFNVQYNVPTNIPIGTSLQYNDTAVYTAPINNWLTDYTPWNNVSAYSTDVVGSWDPNNKEVSPKGVGREGVINTSDSVLTYTIHFENTGNYFAQNIYVLDTLSSNLNISTLKPIYSNHSFTTSVSETGVIKFSFNNIYLPYYEPTSIGELIYTIHLRPNLPNFTQIKNTAYIYFDYNAAVITNTTINTIGQATGVNNQLGIKNEELGIFPNPSSGLFNITSTSAINKIEVFNLLGEVVCQSQINSLQSTIDLSKEVKGIYFVQVQTEKGIVNRKIIVE